MTIGLSDIVLLFVSIGGIVGIISILYYLMDEKRYPRHIPHPLFDHHQQNLLQIEDVGPQGPQGHQEAEENEDEQILIQRRRFERVVVAEDENNNPVRNVDKKMTKKMLMKAEKRRIKTQRRLDEAAWIQAKMEHDRIKQERYYERYGYQYDSDDSNDDDGNEGNNNNGDDSNQVQLTTIPKKLVGYKIYTEIFPEILSYLQKTKYIDIKGLQLLYDIDSTSTVVEIIEHFERSGVIHGIFLHEDENYFVLDQEIASILATKLKDLKKFNLTDIQTVFQAINIHS